MWLTRINFLRNHFRSCKYSTDNKIRRILVKPITEPSRAKRAGLMKALHRENKEMFGELLETKRGKVSRENKMAKQNETSADPNAIPHETVFVAVKHHHQGPKVETDDFDLKTSVIVPLASIPLEPAINISKHGDRDGDIKITRSSESKWMTKTFAKRTKVFTKVLPSGGTTPSSTSTVREPDTTSPMYKQLDVTTTSSANTSTSLSKAEMTPKELGEIPTLKQFLASIHQCQDINHYGEVKQIRKGGTTTGSSKSSATTDSSPPLQSVPNANEEDKVIEGLDMTLTENKTKADEERAITETKAKVVGSTGSNGPNTSSSSHDSFSSSSAVAPDLHLPFLGVVGNEEDMISAGYKLFPFDNPGRQTSDDSHLPASSPAQILSLPYPQGGNYGGASLVESNSNPKFPSVTRILTATMSAQQLKILKLWEDKMIRELGEDGFKKYKEELFGNGKLLHKNLQSLLSGKSIDDLNISQSIEGHWRSLQGILDQIKNTSVLESYVTHPELRYSGIVDCVVTYRDKLVLIDWKTSEKPKPFISNTYDTPLQIAAYIGAINYDPNYKIKVVEGLAVIAYKDGKDCQIFHLKTTDILKYWKQWLQRLKLYHSREN